LPPALLFIIISPAAVGNIFMGQTGFISAALLTAGLQLASTRPIAAGALLGLLSYKPRLGALVPIALAAAGS
jgi:alpha-1,2-mannosyltransferase